MDGSSMLFIGLTSLAFLQITNADYFRQLPVKYLSSNANTIASMTTSNIYDCAELGKNGDVLVIYVTVNDDGNYTCSGMGPIRGWYAEELNVQESGNRSYIYYIRSKSKCLDCMAAAEAERALLVLTYGASPCPPFYNFTYDNPSGYCWDYGTAYYYGNRYPSYRVSVAANRTAWIMSRGQGSQAIAYTCDYNIASVTLFNGEFYCYAGIDSAIDDVRVVRLNLCSLYMTKSYPLKFVNQLSLGVVYLLTCSGFSGIIKYQGKWQYYDGTAYDSSYVKWASGQPTTGNFAMIQQDGLSLYSWPNNSNAGSTVRHTLNCIGPALSRS